MKNLRNGIELFFLRFFIALCSSLDDHCALRFGQWLGEFVALILRSRRRVALRNMELCRVGINPSERRLIFKRMLQNFGMTLAEFARLKVYSESDYLSKMNFIDGHNLEEALKLGRGAILLSGHYDNWEFLVQGLAARGHKISVIVRQQHNLAADKILNHLRQTEKIKVIVAETQSRQAIRALREGQTVALLLDLWGGKDGRPSLFFGYEVSTLSGILEIAIRHQIPILLGFSRRLVNGRHLVYAPIPIIPGTSADNSSVDALLALYHRALEEAIRQRPFLWLWTHKRFKGVIDYR